MQNIEKVQAMSTVATLKKMVESQAMQNILTALKQEETVTRPQNINLRVISSSKQAH